jgi:hypothetical protein
VSQWCSDWALSSKLAGPARHAPQVDPTGPTTGRMRLIRGNGWWDDGNSVSSSYFSSMDPKFGAEFVGMRLVLNVSDVGTLPPGATVTGPELRPYHAPQADALRKAVESDPALDLPATQKAVHDMMRALESEPFLDAAGLYTNDPHAHELAEVFKAVGAPLWFEIDIKTEADRLKVTEAYVHLGVPAFERYRAMSRTDPEFISFVKSQPLGVMTSLEVLLETATTDETNNPSAAAWRAKLKAIADPLGLKTTTHADMLRTCIELWKRGKRWPPEQ